MMYGTRFRASEMISPDPDYNTGNLHVGHTGQRVVSLCRPVFEIRTGKEMHYAPLDVCVLF